MFIKGICNKCNGVVILDIGNSSVADAKERISHIDFGECKSSIGWHVEIGVLSDYISFDWDNIRKSKEEFDES